MKNIARKTPRKKSNILSLVDNSKFKANQAEINVKRATDELCSYTLNDATLQFQQGDKIICRDYCGEDLSPNDIVVARTERSDKCLTTVANAIEIKKIVVAYKREVYRG